MGKQFTEYMDPKLSNSLTAYRKNNGRETTLILLRLVEKWKMDLVSRKDVGVLFSDMSKVFDSVSPPLLNKKLESYTFSESALNLLRSYFSHRRNRVKLGPVTSQRKNTISFQNDITYTTEEGISMYADDHQVFGSGSSASIVEERLLSEGSKITKWYKENLLHVNVQKYQSLLIGSGTDANNGIKPAYRWD